MWKDDFTQLSEDRWQAKQQIIQRSLGGVGGLLLILQFNFTFPLQITTTIQNWREEGGRGEGGGHQIKWCTLHVIITEKVPCKKKWGPGVGGDPVIITEKVQCKKNEGGYPIATCPTIIFVYIWVIANLQCRFELIYTKSWFSKDWIRITYEKQYFNRKIILETQIWYT